MDLLERFKDDPLPFAKWLGIDLVSAAPDRIVAEMTVCEHLCTRPAVLHGGAIMAFADTLGALGTIANLEPVALTVQNAARAFEKRRRLTSPTDIGSCRRLVASPSARCRDERTLLLLVIDRGVPRVGHDCVGSFVRVFQ
jgi:1,4-dihydroxy-2-naphthoyl-CoA hydrolase